MKIENLMEKANRYFVDKLMNEDYELKELNSYFANVLIDNKYKFCLWIVNTPNNFKCYDGQYSFMSLEFSEPEKTILHARFNKIWDDVQNRPDEIERRKREYEKLKTEFEPIKSDGQSL